MFARLKTSGKAVYVQIIAHVPGEHLPGTWGYRRAPDRKVVVASLGRVDHHGPETQQAIRRLFSKAASFLRPTRNVGRLSEDELVQALNRPRKGRS